MASQATVSTTGMSSIRARQLHRIWREELDEKRIGEENDYGQNGGDGRSTNEFLSSTVPVPQGNDEKAMREYFERIPMPTSLPPRAGELELKGMYTDGRVVASPSEKSASAVAIGGHTYERKDSRPSVHFNADTGPDASSSAVVVERPTSSRSHDLSVQRIQEDQAEPARSSWFDRWAFVHPQRHRRAASSDGVRSSSPSSDREHENKSDQGQGQAVGGVRARGRTKHNRNSNSLSLSAVPTTDMPQVPAPTVAPHGNASGNGNASHPYLNLHLPTPTMHLPTFLSRGTSRGSGIGVGAVPTVGRGDIDSKAELDEREGETGEELPAIVDEKVRTGPEPNSDSEKSERRQSDESHRTEEDKSRV
jgi:hypothetical protein